VELPSYEHEATLIAQGFVRVAGVDEAGRGPLAGPVVAAAIVLPDDAVARSLGVRDSKQLSALQRDELYDALIERTSAWATARVDPNEIDRINILQASLLAMANAVAQLEPRPSAALVDGNRSPAHHFPDGFAPQVITVVRGDQRSVSIAAASILAKVTRDRIMEAYDAEYPGYGFASHKGYPSPSHRRAIETLGVCPIHRRTFRGVREFCENAHEPSSRR